MECEKRWEKCNYELVKNPKLKYNITGLGNLWVY